MTSLTSRSSKTLQLHEFMRNGQNDKITVICLKDSFFIKLAKMQRKPDIKCFIYSPV